MCVIEIKNSEKIFRCDIPSMDFEGFKNTICSMSIRVINLFVNKEYGQNRMYAIFANDTEGRLYLTTTYIGDSYPSLTLVKPCLQMFEREIFESNNIEPVGHPFLKPVRKLDGYEFLKSNDLQSHEVAVGPVHAGIIEPGHFRFLCNGERVNHLEIQLGFQHRGVEKLLKSKPTVQLAESICGDSTIANALLFARSVEKLSSIRVSQREQIIRLIALEMERMAIHIGDIGAILGDIAYHMGAEILGVTRTIIINTMLEICGSRFGKGLMRVGGVNFDIDEELSKVILSALDKANSRVNETVDAAFSNPIVLSRFENTGVVSKKNAKEIGLVGLAGRASSQKTDARMFSKEDYKNFEPTILDTSDVYARTYLRYLEIQKSTKLIKEFLEQLDGEISSERNYINLSPNSFVFSIVEGWRGELTHCILTDDNGFIEKYKIKDPSFNNWFGLALAVRNNQISDFPLCNKSFDLSYCGVDL